MYIIFNLLQFLLIVVEAMMATVIFIWDGGKKDYICIFPSHMGKVKLPHSFSCFLEHIGHIQTNDEHDTESWRIGTRFSVMDGPTQSHWFQSWLVKVTRIQECFETAASISLCTNCHGHQPQLLFDL